MTRKTATRPNLQQTMRIVRLIEEYCQTQSGKAVYEEGWDDQRIAEEAGLDTHAPVQRIRRELVGELYRPRTGKAATKDRVEDLERKVKSLEEATEMLSNRLYALEQRNQNSGIPQGVPLPLGYALKTLHDEG